MEIVCVIHTKFLVNDEGRNVEGVTAECEECGHETESFGRSSVSVRRCLALMREECPMGQRNWYVTDDGSDEDGI